MPKYKITDETGSVRTIVADEAFVRSSYPNSWELVDATDMDAERRVAEFQREVKVYREHLMQVGCLVSLLDYEQPIAVQGREQDKVNLMGLKDAGLAFPEREFQFRDGDNEHHLLTGTQMVRIYLMGSEWVSKVMQASWALQEIEPIEDVSIWDGWPDRIVTEVIGP